MGLPARQRRVLDHIDRALRGSDPRLAALYAIFGRLAQDEEIPRFEQLRSGALAWLAVLGAMLATIGSHLHLRVPGRRRVRASRQAGVSRRAGVTRQASVSRRAGVSRPASVSRRAGMNRRARMSRSVRGGGKARARRRVRLPLRPRQRAILLYPLAIALAIGSIVLAARSGPDRTCLPVRAVAAAKHVAKSSLCQSPRGLSPMMFGR